MSDKKPAVKRPVRPVAAKKTVSKPVVKTPAKPITVLSKKETVTPPKDTRSIKEKVEKTKAITERIKTQSSKPLTPATVTAKTTSKAPVKKAVKPVKAVVKQTPVAKTATPSKTIESKKYEARKVSLDSLVKKDTQPKPVSSNKISFKDLMSNMTANMGNGFIPGQAR